MKSIYDAYKKVVSQQQPQKEVVVETTLNKQQQQQVDRMVDDAQKRGISESTEAKIHDALGHAQFKAFPLPDAGSDVEPDSDVVEHLSDHGYDIHDYVKGIASKKVTVGDPSRGIPLREKVVQHTIGSVLQRTKAEPHVMHAFLHDPARSATRGINENATHHVVISKTPYAVGGMSTGTSWTSCMNLNTGSNNHYIPRDIEKGTHVAYLVKHDDTTAFEHGEPSKPIARIALKPFHADDGEDTIFRPEERVYGNGNQKFERAVSEWAVKNYPAKPGLTYQKDRSVYDDTGRNVYRAEKLQDVKRRLDRNESPVKEAGAMLDNHIIDGAIAHIKQAPTLDKINKMLDVGNLNNRHIIDMHRMSKQLPEAQQKSALWGLAVRHGDKFTTSMHNEFAQHKFASRPAMLLRSPKLPDHVVDELPNNLLNQVQRSKIKPHHVDRVVDAFVNGKSGSYYDANDMAWAMKSHHIDALVKAGKAVGHPAVAGHPEMSKETFDAGMQHKNSQELLLMHSQHASVDALKHVAASDREKALFNLASNKHLTGSDAKAVADEFVNSKIAKHTEYWKSGGKGYLQQLEIPSPIGAHVDYDKLATAPYNMEPHFHDANHSWNYVDATYKHALHTDKEYTKWNNSENDNFNEDDHWKAIDRYNDALHEHYNSHVLTGDDGVDHEHLAKMLNRVDDHYSAFENDQHSFDDIRDKVREKAYGVGLH